MIRLLSLTFAVLLAVPVVAQSEVPHYVLYETVRKPYLSFPPSCKNQISWTQPILKGNADPDIEQEGEVDGRVLIDNGEPMTSKDKVMSLIEWTKPVHDMRVDRLVMHLAAQDMRRGTTFRAQTLIQGEISPGARISNYGPAYVVYTPYMKYLAGGGVVTGLGGLVNTVVNQGYYEFRIRVQISDGGNCFEEPVIYKFRRLEEGNNRSTNNGSGNRIGSERIVLQSDFDDFGLPNGAWGNGVQYGRNGIWWNSGNARTVAKVINQPSGYDGTGLYIRNDSGRSPHMYGTTAIRVSLTPGQRYRIRFLGAARNLASNGGVNIAVDPEWRIRPVSMSAGTYDPTPFEGTFTATNSFADIRIISEDRGEVVLSNFIVELVD
ncbi:MAG: hypothetical protein PHI97_33845 [Desulfobulbus sp.]|nr:hypothetical protein [Desulfobulbus sp.]